MKQCDVFLSLINEEIIKSVTIQKNVSLKSYDLFIQYRMKKHSPLLYWKGSLTSEFIDNGESAKEFLLATLKRLAEKQKKLRK